MKILFAAAVALLALALASPALAASSPNAPTYKNPAGVDVATQGVFENRKFEVTDCSGTITAGGTAQILFQPGVGTHGWQFENQSAGDLFTRSMGPTSSLSATQDQNSLKIVSGAYYEAPHTSVNAYSVVGATTGQAFYCRAW